MPITADIQTLEPGAWVELFELDATSLGAELYRFHGYPQQSSIFWQGLEYSPWPIQAEGFEMKKSCRQTSGMSSASLPKTTKW